jgi:hypothetical protein
MKNFANLMVVIAAARVQRAYGFAKTAVRALLLRAACPAIEA